MNNSETDRNLNKALPKYLPLSTGVLILVVSFAGGASWEAIIYRVVLSVFLMFITGKIAALLLDFGSLGNLTSEQECEQELNTQIDSQLEQALAQDPKRAVGLAKKMGMGS